MPGEKIGVSPFPLRGEIFARVEPLLLQNQCVSDLYYTSLPAKCRAVGGELVQVGPDQRGFIIIPLDKLK